MATILPVVEYQAREARAYWRSVVIGGVLTPLFYVLALGVGLGTVVNRNGGAQLGVPYLQFVAPAFVVAAALQIGAGMASWPVMSKFKWERVFHGMAATPLSPARIADGVLAWVAIRLFLNSAVFFAIMAAFGAVHRWWALLTVPAATLCGVAMSSAVLAFTASREDEGQGFNVLFRFIVTPMFLFSGTFYPVSKLPDWGEWLAYATPLYHGVQLARAASIGHQSVWTTLGSLAYLLVMTAVGLVLAHRYFRVRLTK
jgi:lipooligosaccharide transport system permease protein